MIRSNDSSIRQLTTLLIDNAIKYCDLVIDYKRAQYQEMIDREGNVNNIALFGNIPVSTTAKGLANFAIVLGGLDVLVIALGALNSIPHFSDFLESGVSVVNTLFSILENMFNLRILGSIALIALFGAVPVQPVPDTSDKAV